MTREERKELIAFDQMVKRGEQKGALVSLTGNLFFNNNKTIIMKKRHFSPDEIKFSDPGAPAAEAEAEAEAGTTTTATSTDEGGGSED